MDWTRKEFTISELFDKYKNFNLVLQPFFQRNLVWTEKAKSHFIESILLGMPVSEIYLSKENDKYSVIDGQQRLSTILHFIENKFTLSKLENLVEFNGKSFEQIDQSSFLAYKISYVEIENAKKEEVIDMYSRINKYTVNLNEQELRKSAFGDSDFLKLAEEFSQIDFFEIGKFFSPRKRQRMNDVEFSSELLCVFYDGLQDKKNKLDKFYDKFSTLTSYTSDKKVLLKIIDITIEVFSSTFLQNYLQNDKYDGTDGVINISKTRYKQISDFYSFFAVINDFFIVQKESFSVEQMNLFSKYLMLYSEMIEPEADISIFSEYGIKSSTQSNTYASRMYRYKVLMETLKFIRSKDANELTDTLIKEMREVFDITFNPEDFDVRDIVCKVDAYYDQQVQA